MISPPLLGSGDIISKAEFDLAWAKRAVASERIDAILKLDLRGAKNKDLFEMTVCTVLLYVLRGRVQVPWFCSLNSTNRVRKCEVQPKLTPVEIT